MKSNLEQSVEIITDKTAFELVTEIAKLPDQEEPFFVVDLADIVRKYKVWKLKMPRVQPYYAVKCNDCPVVLNLLAALGTSFDCASKTEIEAVLSIGVESSRIIYANPCKTRSFIKHAASVGVDLMTFDNEMELLKVKAIYPDAKLVIRIRVDDSSAICKLGMKFGCDVENAEHLLKVAKDLDLNVVGVSFHVGSGCTDSSAYTKAISSAHHVFNIADEIGFKFYLLDIGGGFPGTRNEAVSFEEIATVANVALDEYFPEGSGIEILAEPGRYFVASAFTLCTNIIAKREVIIPEEDGEKSGCMYYLNDGVYGSFNCVIFDHAVLSPIPLLDDVSDRKILHTSLWGPTCDSMDRVMEMCYLPSMNVGEWIVFENMGAYTVTAASTFNGFQKPSMTFVLPSHILSSLQQLPFFLQLVKNAETQTEMNNVGSMNCCMLQMSEPISA